MNAPFRLTFLLPLLLQNTLLAGCATDAPAEPAPVKQAPAAPADPASARAPVAAEPARATAAQEEVKALVEQGRAKLAAGDAAGAQALFEQALAKDAQHLDARVGLLRAWLAQGRVNDTYNAIDALAKTHKGVEIDYLYGMAFATDAKRGIETGQAGPMTGTKIEDAVQFLVPVVEKESARFPDAPLMLCWAAWESRKVDVGRAAAEKAVHVAPANPEAHFQLGRFALAQFQRDQADEAKKTAADGHWQMAKRGFEKAASLLDGASEPEKRSMLARVVIDLGHVHQWKGETDSAVANYGRGFGLDPALPNYAQLLGALGQEKFLAALELGARESAKLRGADDPSDATLLWWLGWTRLQQKDYEQAEKALAAAVKKVPQYVNSWFYIAVCRFSRQDPGGAVEAVRKHVELNAADLVASVQQNPSFNLAMLDALVGFCASKEPVRNEDAAVISEVQATAEPTEVRYWNNAGLFYRDAGDGLRRAKDEATKKKALEFWERAYAAYTRALELAPDDPAILNDTAVLLHYNLDRDLDKAKEMYKKAAARAEELLQQTDLKPDQRDLYETALRDARNNLKRLEAGIKTNG